MTTTAVCSVPFWRRIDRILLGQLDLDAIRLQGIRVDTVDYLLQGLKGHDNVTYLSAGDELDVIGLHMKVLYTGTPEILSESTNVLNDGSMVFKLSGQKRSMLFLGDIGDNNADNRALYPDTGAGSKIGCEIADTILARCQGRFCPDGTSWKQPDAGLFL